MSDPVVLADKKSEKSKVSQTSKKSKKSNATPIQSSEKGENKSQNSQISKNKNNNIEQNIPPSQNQEVKPMIEEQNPEPKVDNSVPTISVRAYLEQNVTAVVQEALLEVARQRPPNPLQFVGNFILERANAK